MLSYRAPHGVVRGRDIACARSDSARSRVLNSWLARGSFFGLAKGSGRRVARRSSSEGTPIDPESKEPADIVVADTVVDGKPAAVPASGRTDNIDATSILKGLVGIVKDNGRALISIYVVTEAVNFLANRAFHRLTNQIAMTMLAIPQQAIGNVWWLSQVRTQLGHTSLNILRFARWPIRSSMGVSPPVSMGRLALAGMLCTPPPHRLHVCRSCSSPPLPSSLPPSLPLSVCLFYHKITC